MPLVGSVGGLPHINSVVKLLGGPPVEAREHGRACAIQVTVVEADGAPGSKISQQIPSSALKPLCNVICAACAVQHIVPVITRLGRHQMVHWCIPQSGGRPEIRAIVARPAPVWVASCPVRHFA
jgi:hypothetical protein